MNANPALAIDLGGTFLRSAVVHPDGRLGRRTRSRLRTVFDGETSDAVWANVVDGLGRLSDDARDDLGAGAPLVVSFPGPVSAASTLSFAPTLTGASAVPPDLVARIAARAARPVKIHNDVAAAARYLAITTDATRFMLVTVSSGVGSRVVAGSDGAQPSFGGEIGHLVVDSSPNAAPCDCGGRGHLGAVASGRAIERAALASAGADPDAFAASACARLFGATPATLTNERHLVPALLLGDPWATGLLDHAIGYLAHVVLTAIVAAGLERVYVIGGFAAALGDTYGKRLETAIRALTDSGAIALSEEPVVRVIRLSDEAFLLGAAALG